MIYSLEERKIGSWLGADLYQITGQLSSDELVDGYASLTLEGVDRVIDIHYNIMSTDKSNDICSDMSTYAQVSSASNVSGLAENINKVLMFNSYYLDDDTPTLDIKIPDGLYNNFSDFTVYVTLQYTKTA